MAQSRVSVTQVSDVSGHSGLAAIKKKKTQTKRNYVTVIKTGTNNCITFS